jgi:hypothetical protein
MCEKVVGQICQLWRGLCEKAVGKMSVMAGLCEKDWDKCISYGRDCMKKERENVSVTAGTV